MTARWAWKRKTRQYRVGSAQLGGGGPIVAWQGRAVVPYFAGPGNLDLASVVDIRGDEVATLPAPGPHTGYRTAWRPTVVWPDERLVVGVTDSDHRFSLAWSELGGATERFATALGEIAVRGQRTYELSTMTDGGVAVSVVVGAAQVSPESVGWPIDAQLTGSLFEPVRRWAFEDFEHATHVVSRGGGVRWHAPGRLGFVADEVAVFEQGVGIAKALVGRRVSDGTVCWRIVGADHFVLGGNALPAWSDDRVYVVDRGARRREAWAREGATIAALVAEAGTPLPTRAVISFLGRARDQAPLHTASTLRCLSTRTGGELWHADVAGDVVAFHCHPAWVACVIAGDTEGAIRCWSHDGGERAAVAVTRWAQPSPSTWPPDPARWPALVDGGEDYLVVAQNRNAGQGNPRLYRAPIAALDHPTWEVPLPAPCVTPPMFGWHRLLNQTTIVLVDGGAVLRWGKQLHGLEIDERP